MHPIAVLYASVALATAQLQLPRTPENTQHEISWQITRSSKANADTFAQGGTFENANTHPSLVKLQAKNLSPGNFQQNGSTKAYKSPSFNTGNMVLSQVPVDAVAQTFFSQKKKKEFSLYNSSKTLPFSSRSQDLTVRPRQWLRGSFTTTLPRLNGPYRTPTSKDIENSRSINNSEVRATSTSYINSVNRSYVTVSPKSVKEIGYIRAERNKDIENSRNLKDSNIRAKSKSYINSQNIQVKDSVNTINEVASKGPSNNKNVQLRIYLQNKTKLSGDYKDDGDFNEGNFPKKYILNRSQIQNKDKTSFENDEKNISSNMLDTQLRFRIPPLAKDGINGTASYSSNLVSTLLESRSNPRHKAQNNHTNRNTRIQDTQSEEKSSLNLKKKNQQVSAYPPERSKKNAKSVAKLEFTSSHFKDISPHSRHVRRAKIAPFRFGPARPTPTSVQASFFRAQVQKLPTPVRNRLEAIYKRIGFTQEFQTLLMREVMAAGRNGAQDVAQGRTLGTATSRDQRTEGVRRPEDPRFENRGVSLQKRYGFDNNRRTNREGSQYFATRANQRSRFPVSFDSRPIRRTGTMREKPSQSRQLNSASSANRNGLRQNPYGVIPTSGLQQKPQQTFSGGQRSGLTTQQTQMISSLDEVTRARVVDLHKRIGNSERFRATVDRLYRNQLQAATGISPGGNQGGSQNIYRPTESGANGYSGDPALLKVRLMQQELEIIDQQKRLLERQQKLVQQQQLHLQQHQKQLGESQQSGQQQLMRQQSQMVIKQEPEQNYHPRQKQQQQSQLHQNKERLGQLRLQQEQQRLRLQQQQQQLQQQRRYRVQQEQHLHEEQQRLQQRYFQQQQMFLQRQRQEHLNFQQQRHQNQQVQRTQLQQQNSDRINTQHQMDENRYDQRQQYPRFQDQQSQRNVNVYNRMLANTGPAQPPLQVRNLLSGVQRNKTIYQQMRSQKSQEPVLRGLNVPESVRRRSQSKPSLREPQQTVQLNNFQNQRFGDMSIKTTNLRKNPTSPKTNEQVPPTTIQSNIYIQGTTKSDKVKYLGAGNNNQQQQNQTQLQQQEQQKHHDHHHQLQHQRSQEKLHQPPIRQLQAQMPQQKQNLSLEHNQKHTPYMKHPQQRQTKPEGIQNSTQKLQITGNEKQNYQQQPSTHSTPGLHQRKSFQEVQHKQLFVEPETTTEMPTEIHKYTAKQNDFTQLQQNVPQLAKELPSYTIPTLSPLIKVFDTPILIPDHINRNPIMREAFINVIVKAKIEAEIRNNLKSMSKENQSASLITQPLITPNVHTLTSDSVLIPQLPLPSQAPTVPYSVISSNIGLSDSKQLSHQHQLQHQEQQQQQVQQQYARPGHQNQYYENHGKLTPHLLPVFNDTSIPNHVEVTTPLPKPHTRALDLTVELAPALFLTWALEEPQIAALEGSNIEDILRTIATTIDKTVLNANETSSGANAAIRKAEQFRAFLIDTLLEDPLSYTLTSGNVHHQTYYERLDRGPSVLIKELREGFIMPKDIGNIKHMLDQRRRRKRAAKTIEDVAQNEKGNRESGGNSRRVFKNLKPAVLEPRFSITESKCIGGKFVNCNPSQFKTQNQTRLRRFRRNFGRFSQIPRFPILRFIWLLPRGTFPTNPGEAIEYIMKKYGPPEMSTTPSTRLSQNVTTPPTSENYKTTSQSLTVLRPDPVQHNIQTNKTVATEPRHKVSQSISIPINGTPMSIRQRLMDAATTYRTINRKVTQFVDGDKFVANHMSNSYIPLPNNPTAVPLSTSAWLEPYFTPQQNFTMGNTFLSPGMITHLHKFNASQMAVLFQMLNGNGGIYPSHISSTKPLHTTIIHSTPQVQLRFSTPEGFTQNLQKARQHQQLSETQPQFISSQEAHVSNQPKVFAPTPVAPVQKDLYLTILKKTTPTQPTLVKNVSDTRHSLMSTLMQGYMPASLGLSNQDLLKQYELFQEWRRSQKEAAIISRPPREYSSYLEPSLQPQDHKQEGNYRGQQTNHQSSDTEIGNSQQLRQPRLVLQPLPQRQNEGLHLLQEQPLYQPEQQQQHSQQQQDSSSKNIEQSMFEATQVQEAGQQSVQQQQQQQQREKQQHKPWHNEQQLPHNEQTILNPLDRDHLSHTTQNIHLKESNTNHRQQSPRIDHVHNRHLYEQQQQAELNPHLKEHYHQQQQPSLGKKNMNFSTEAMQPLEHSSPTPSSVVTHPLFSSLAMKYPDVPPHVLSSLLRTIFKQTDSDAATVAYETSQNSGKEMLELKNTTFPTYVQSSDPIVKSGNFHVSDNPYESGQRVMDTTKSFPAPTFPKFSQQQLQRQSQAPAEIETAKLIIGQQDNADIENTQVRDQSKSTLSSEKTLVTPGIFLEGVTRTSDNPNTLTTQYRNQFARIYTTHIDGESDKNFGKPPILMEANQLPQGHNQQEMLYPPKNSSRHTEYYQYDHSTQRQEHERLNKVKAVPEETPLLLTKPPTQMPIAFPPPPFTTAAIFSNRYITMNSPHAEQIPATPATTQDIVNQPENALASNKRIQNLFQSKEKGQRVESATPTADNPALQFPNLFKLPQQIHHSQGDQNPQYNIQGNLMGQILSSVPRVKTSSASTIMGVPYTTGIRHGNGDSKENSISVNTLMRNGFYIDSNGSHGDKTGGLNTVKPHEDIATKAIHHTNPNFVKNDKIKLRQDHLLPTPLASVLEVPLNKVVIKGPYIDIPTEIPFLPGPGSSNNRSPQPANKPQINTDLHLMSVNLDNALSSMVDASRVSKNVASTQKNTKPDPSIILTTLRNHQGVPNHVRENIPIFPNHDSNLYTHGQQAPQRDIQEQPLQVQQTLRPHTIQIQKLHQDTVLKTAQQQETQHQTRQQTRKQSNQLQQLVQPQVLQQQRNDRIQHEQAEPQPIYVQQAQQKHPQQHQQMGTVKSPPTVEITQRPAVLPMPTTPSPFEDYWKFLVWQSRLIDRPNRIGPTPSTLYNTKHPGFLDALRQPPLQTTTLATTTTTTTSATTTTSTIPPPRCHCAPTRPSARLNQFCTTRCDVTIGTCSSALCRCSCSGNHGLDLSLSGHQHLTSHNSVDTLFRIDNNGFGHVMPRLIQTTPPSESYNAIDSLGFAISAVEPSPPPPSEQLQPPSSFSDLAQMSDTRFNRFMDFMAGKARGEKKGGGDGGGGAKEMEPDR